MQSVNSPPSWWYYAEVNAHYILMSRDHHDYHLHHLTNTQLSIFVSQGFMKYLEILKSIRFRDVYLI